MRHPYDPTRHNYAKKLLRLQAEGKIPPGFHQVTVLHDDWCPALKEPPSYCTCDPEIRLRKQAA